MATLKDISYDEQLKQRQQPARRGIAVAWPVISDSRGTGEYPRDREADKINIISWTWSFRLANDRHRHVST